jgi:hypothetical protein
MTATVLLESVFPEAKTIMSEKFASGPVVSGYTGTETSMPTADNPFWHTGQPVPLAAGEYKTRRPWEWVWLVAQGRAFGKGSASLESIDEWGERMAADAF